MACRDKHVETIFSALNISSVKASVVCCAVLQVLPLQLVSEWAAKRSGTDLREMYERRILFLLLLFSLPCCASYSAGWPGWHNGRRCPIKVQMLHHIKSAGHTGGLVTSGTYSFCCCCQFSEITVKVEGLKLSEAQTSIHCASGWPVVLWLFGEEPQM